MKAPFKFRKVPVDFGDRFPDGDYTIGRGADPRGRAESGKVKSEAESSDAKPKPAKGTRATRTAAE